MFEGHETGQKIEITRPTRPISSHHGKSFFGVTSRNGFFARNEYQRRRLFC
jgi:hypothetical protein